MKLAFVAPRWAEGGVVGGAETLIRELALHAAGRGHEVHVLTTCARNHYTWANERAPGVEQREGVSLHFFPVNEDRDVGVFLEVQDRINKRQRLPRADQLRWLNNSVCSRALLAHLEEQGETYDAILAGPYLFGITWQVSRVHPDRTWLIPCLHDEPFAKLEEIGDMFRSVRGLLFNAEPEQALARRLYGLPAERCHVVGMGMPRFDADPAAFAKRHGITRPYLLYCGRREAGKNTPLLLDYVDTYRRRRRADLLLVLTGSGEYEAPEDLAGHILDLGFVSETEKHEAMAGAAVFLHPSVNESFGIVLLEAWLAGTPAMVHEASEVLRHQCASSGAGLWFRFYPEFEAQLDLLLEQPELRARLGACGRRYVETEYTWEAVGARLFAALSGGEPCPGR